MKKGDIVKHPKGMVNVCEKQYWGGIVLQVSTHPHPVGSMTQCLVLWRGPVGPMMYLEDQLEIICEAR